MDFIKNEKIINGTKWKDMNGNLISAHGGNIIKKDVFYYWFGENRNGRKKISCYRSKDLVNWEFRNDVLTIDSDYEPYYVRTEQSLNPNDTVDHGYGEGAIIERPKVIYNKYTDRYVMWMHWENGKNYNDARCAVASCTNIDGEYVYHGSFNPIGYMSRDCNLFLDDDGTAYFISNSRDNADLNIYSLSEDYLSISEHIKTLWPGQYREAPVLMRRGRYYFILTSACTGWLPNQSQYAFSTSIRGKWSNLINIGDATTYDTQPAFVLTINGNNATTYLYVGDRWDPSSYHDSTYVFLPLEFPEDNSMLLNWAGVLSIDTETGLYDCQVTETGSWRIKSIFTEGYLCRVKKDEKGLDKIENSKLHYEDEDLIWILEKNEDGFFRIKSKSNEQYVSAGKSIYGDNSIFLADYSEDYSQEWAVTIISEQYCKIINRNTKKVLEVNSHNKKEVYSNIDSEKFDKRIGVDPQVFMVLKVY